MSSFRVIAADILEGLREMPDASFDACMCDPPYHLTQVSRGGSQRINNPDAPFSSRTAIGSRGFMGKTWDGGDVAMRPETWAAVRRVLKPGAPLLAFGGTRTHHRLMCAIEDAGFEIRDCLMWLYGSGFPKSLDISKAIDKAGRVERKILSTRLEHDICRPSGGGDERLMSSRGAREVREVLVTAPWSADSARWSGYGSALKPAWEPIILAMKPCDGTFAENALKHGVAGINVDGGRIDCDSRPKREVHPLRENVNYHGNYLCGRADGTLASSKAVEETSLGRWPANLILEEESAALLDEQTGTLTSGANPKRRGSDKFRQTYSAFEGQRDCIAHRGADQGGASRFFYCAKASTSERNSGGVKNNHPTVKPLDLCAYLARLILPPGRTTQRRLIVPFSGSGSEMIGALRSGWDYVVGIELDQEYVTIARNRILRDSPMFTAEASA